MFNKSKNLKGYASLVKHPKLASQLCKKKLDGVGPVDNRPSTDKLHHFGQKNVTFDT